MSTIYGHPNDTDSEAPMLSYHRGGVIREPAQVVHLRCVANLCASGRRPRPCPDQCTDAHELAAAGARQCCASDHERGETGHTAANSGERIHRLIYGGTVLLIAVVGLGALIAWGSRLTT